MPINISTFLQPSNGNTFFLLEDTFLKGGFRVTPTIASRDAIPAINLKIGCRVYVQENGVEYKYSGLDGYAITTWEEVIEFQESKFVRVGSWVGAGGPVVQEDTFDLYTYFNNATVIKGIVIFTNGGPGSLSLDILKGSYTGFPSSNPITPAQKPSISLGTKYKDLVMTDWNLTIENDEFLALRLISSSTFTVINVFLLF